ncbi:sensor histidine kinase [Syntrophomonas wolfei]|uniref:histidine kinase n=1 Tax=Syntrophomonas wolfei subsp. wolfei (strain DSM 2245B / Goettingen) TaxID=335541 RepID=Q0B0G7_SYNWW|nr:sensor histidine kinase [Syntrophomonas wolfei]ABI67537.1 histidine kinase [Syntrophomonas wolfei subsp. wolfei str. Goettingen G311]
MAGNRGKAKSEEKQPIQLGHLENILGQLVGTLEKGRNDIYDIAEKCYQECNRLELEREEVNREASRTIVEVEKYEKLERYARLRLAEVSRNFLSFSENDIKDAYDKARILQLTLLDLRQKEMYLRRRRDQLDLDIKQFKAIALKADGFLSSTGVALKILQGNVERIGESIEEFQRQQQLGMWIIESQEAERRKIARELHDGPAQNLVSMLIRLDLIAQLGYEEKERISDEINNIKDMARESLADIRSIMFDLKPLLVHEHSFCQTLREFFSEYEAHYNFTTDLIVLGDDRDYDFSMEIALFRLIQEAITNVKKHAGVNHAMVKIENTDKCLRLVIKDEGRGFSVEGARANKESYGIIGMKERVEIFGGEIEIISSPGSGTQVIVRIPWEEEGNNG